MPQHDYDAPVLLEDDGVDEEESEYECFDVQLWAEAYRADVEAQAEHGRFPGLPFH